MQQLPTTFVGAVNNSTETKGANMITFLIVVSVLGVLWRAYMATFKTDEYVRLSEMENRQKQDRRERVARIGATLLSGLFRWK